MLNNVPGIDLQLYPVKTSIMQEQNEKNPPIQGPYRASSLEPFLFVIAQLIWIHARDEAM